MAGGYTPPAGEGLGPLLRELLDIKQRLSTLEIPTGTSVNSLVDQVQEAIANIGTTINTWLLANSYTKSQIDSLVASPGAITPTSVVATGGVSGATAVFNGGLKSTDVYSHLLTYGGPYTATYTHSDGTMGTVPSSRRYKQDIETAEFDPAVLSYLRVVTYRYIAAVQNPDYVASVEVGLIAEEVHDLGLTWLVDYDEDGNPNGVRYDRLALVCIPWVQSIEARLSAAGI